MTKLSKEALKFIEELKDPVFARQKLEESLRGPQGQFLFLLRRIIEGRGGLKAFSEKTGIGVTNLYKILSPHGNPSVKTLDVIMGALGISFKLELTMKDDMENTVVRDRRPTTQDKGTFGSTWIFKHGDIGWHYYYYNCKDSDGHYWTKGPSACGCPFEER